MTVDHRLRRIVHPCTCAWLVVLWLLSCGSSGSGKPSLDGASGGQITLPGGSGGSDGTADANVGTADANGGTADATAGNSDSGPACSVTTKSLGAKACTTPYLTWTGSDLLALWPDSFNFVFRGARFTADGTAVGTTWTSQITPSWCHFSAAWNNDAAAIFYVGQSPTVASQYDQCLATVNEDGATVMQPQGISTPVSPQGGESLRWNGTAYGAAWFVGSETTARFAEISATGVPLFSPVLAPGSGGIFDLAVNPAGGWWWFIDNAGFASDLITASVSTAGSITGSQSTHITDLITSPRVIGSGPSMFVAYGNDDDDRIHVRSLDGQNLGADRVVGTDGYEAALSMAWNGKRFGLSWYGLNYSAGKTTIHFIELDASGAPIGTATTVSAVNQGADFQGGRNRSDWLAWTGDHWALAWLANRDVNDVMLSAIRCP